MIVGIDVDEVLGRFDQDIERWAKKKYGLKIINQYVYPLNKRFNIDDGLKLLCDFIMDDGYENMRPYLDVINFFNSLKYKKIIITSRYPTDDPSINKTMKNKIITSTLDWLDNNKVEYDKIIFSKNKIKHIKKEGVSVFFEDFFDNAEKIGRAIKSFLITRDWNCKEEPIYSTRIDRIEDAAEYLKKAAVEEE